MITANIIQRVLMVKYGEQIGTAFTVEIDEKQYLISAKHIFKDLSKESKIEILKGGVWQTINVKPIFCENHWIDIIAFELDKDLTTTRKLPITLTLDQTGLSQDIYFLGYPYGIKHDYHSSDGFALPLVKKGIVSAINGDVVWCDGHNNPGFSGGPIVIKKGNSNDIQIISVISGYRNDNKTGENSGIFYGYSIDLIVNAIKKSK